MLESFSTKSRTIADASTHQYRHYGDYDPTKDSSERKDSITMSDLSKGFVGLEKEGDGFHYELRCLIFVHQRLPSPSFSVRGRV